ncbi:MAG: leucine-rich repeat domain-containing protein [Clostridia bacterium]|nr:leucine-rich repeat domain-containing protein [Clostridia bacterium]
MKKKFLSFMLALCFIIPSIVLFAGCKEGHKHSYGDWQMDAVNHWKVCECGKKSELDEHDYEGETCSVCDAQKPKNLAYTYADWQENSWAVSGFGDYEEGVVVIPETYQGLPVVKINYEAFATEYSNTDIYTKIVIPSSVKEIGRNAFDYRCCDIEFVNPTITEIGDNAFENYMGTNLTIPSTVQTIGQYAFYNNGRMTSFTIPASVTSIGICAFAQCMSLETVTFADGTAIEELPDSLFTGCESLEAFEVPASVKRLTSRNDYYLNDYNGTFRDVTGVITFEEGSLLEHIGKYYFLGFAGTVILPTNYTVINEGAFYATKGAKIVVHAGVTEVDGVGLSAYDGNIHNYPAPSVFYMGTLTQWEAVTKKTTSLGHAIGDNTVVYYSSEWSFNNGIPVVNS